MLDRPTCPLILVHEALDRAHIVHVMHEVDLATAADFADEIMDVPGDGLVVIDLLDCRFMDTKAIAVLRRAADHYGERLRLVVAPNSIIDRLLMFFSANSTTRIARSLDDALDAPGVTRELLKPRFRRELR
jgi:anti-anti-sigma regulatory factor